MFEKILWEGDEFFNTAFQEIKNARESIVLEMYIFKDDKAGIKWQKQLINAAQKKIKINVIYDKIGSFSTASSFWNQMIQNNIQVLGYRGILKNRKRLVKNNAHYPLWFTDLLLSFFRRNHRKILIIDNKIAFAGGFNIMNETSKLYSGDKRWLDAVYVTNIPLIVKEIEKIHLDSLRRVKYSIRDIVTLERKKAHEAVLYPYHTCLHKRKRRRKFFSKQNICSMRYINAVKKLMNESKKRIYIMTPYFVPPRSIIRKLKRKAKKNIDVRLYMSIRSDLPFIRNVSFYFARKLIKKGIKVFLFHGKELPNASLRFNHAKVFLLDNWCGAGSGNVDDRSFSHNLDIHIFRNNPPFLKDVEDKFKWIEEHSYKGMKSNMPIKLSVFFLLPFKRYL
ncbi:MAG: phospholipase D-like domain-containing protein [Spirochaetia bacterium]|nr:phospholipase D-like domain-containing protein [Spirochaetia bacterium]